MVGSEMWWVLAGIIFWLAWTVATATGEAEEHEKLARKKHGSNDYKSNIAEW
jgi:predicted branched-subunit amino acid permease